MILFPSIINVYMTSTCPVELQFLQHFQKNLKLMYRVTFNIFGFCEFKCWLTVVFIILSSQETKKASNSPLFWRNISSSKWCCNMVQLVIQSWQRRFLNYVPHFWIEWATCPSVASDQACPNAFATSLVVEKGELDHQLFYLH